MPDLWPHQERQPTRPTPADPALPEAAQPSRVQQGPARLATRRVRCCGGRAPWCWLDTTIHYFGYEWAWLCHRHDDRVFRALARSLESSSHE